MVVDDVSADEGAGTLTFTVTLSAPTNVPVSVNYSFVPKSATAVADFVDNGGRSTFAPGVTSLTVAAIVTDDDVFQGNESFLINLADPVNADVADGVGIGTIVDDDMPPVVRSVELGTPGMADDLGHEGAPLATPSSSATRRRRRRVSRSASAAVLPRPTISVRPYSATALRSMPTARSPCRPA